MVDASASLPLGGLPLSPFGMEKVIRKAHIRNNRTNGEIELSQIKANRCLFYNCC